jgi:hypothetical protein
MVALAIQAGHLLTGGDPGEEGEADETELEGTHE